MLLFMFVPGADGMLAESITCEIQIDLQINGKNKSSEYKYLSFTNIQAQIISLQVACLNLFF